MQEQIQTGTSRQMQQEHASRVVEDVACIVCAGTNNPNEMVLCDGGTHTSQWHTGLHQHPKIGWHYDCLPSSMLEMPLEELRESSEDLSWCCKPCAEHNTSAGKHLAWKILKQESRGGSQAYEVQWLGSSETSWQRYSDVSGTEILKQWRVQIRGQR